MPDNASKLPLNILDISNLSALKERHGFVLSANIILACLQGFTVLSRPEHAQKRFKWYVPLFEQNDVESLTEVDPSMLYICGDRSAPSLLEKYNTAFFLVITRDDKVPDWAERNKSRIILVKSEDRIYYLASLIQNIFTGLLVWENELDRIVTAHDSLNRLLDEGSKVLENFMCITDSGYNLLASTEAVAPPDDVMKTLVESGCYPSHEIAHLESDVIGSNASNDVVVDSSRTTHGHDVIHLPIFFNGDYFFHLTMVCTADMMLEGACDFFSFFGERVIQLCNSFWEDIIEVESPWHRVLTNFIEEVPMKDTYIQTQLELTAIPRATFFKLLCLDVSSSDSPTLRSQVVAAARGLNEGFCYPFAYNNSLLVLCYQTTSDDAHFSLSRIREAVHDKIYEPFHIRTSASKTFSDISNMHLAYIQTQLALNFSPALDFEHELADESIIPDLYSFDAAFPYYLIAKMTFDDELTYASMHHSIVKKLADEDATLGTQVVKLLWTYLTLERNATAVSKRLHMHRNTVLYHIDKIEKRFGISFDDFVDRTALLDGFRTFILTDGFRRPLNFSNFLRIEIAEERKIY